MENNNNATLQFSNAKLSSPDEIVKAISEAGHRITECVTFESKELRYKQMEIQDEILILKGRINHLIVMVIALLILVSYNICK
jgi:hypothetical protein